MKATIETNPHAAGKAAHTALPWKLCQESIGGFVETKTGNPLFAIKPLSIEGRRDDEANLQFIVRACNSHAQLVEALEAVAALEDDAELIAYPLKVRFRKAIAQAMSALEAAQ